jgi:hypothetical protein
LRISPANKAINHCLILIALTLAILLTGVRESHALFRFFLSGGVSETYTDNFFASSVENRDPGHQSAFITGIEPGLGSLLTFAYGELRTGYRLNYYVTNINSKIDEYSDEIEYLHHNLDLALEINFQRYFKLLLRESITQDVVRYQVPEDLFFNQADINRLEAIFSFERPLSQQFKVRSAIGAVARRSLNPEYRGSNANRYEGWMKLFYRFFPKSFLFLGARYAYEDYLYPELIEGIYTPDRRITSPVIGFELKIANGLIGAVEYNYQIIQQDAPSKSGIEPETTGHWLKSDIVFNYFEGNETSIYISYFIEPDLYGTYYRRFRTGFDFSYFLMQRWKLKFVFDYQQYRAELADPPPGRSSGRPLNKNYLLKLVTDLEFYTKTYVYADYSYFTYLDGESAGFNTYIRYFSLGLRADFW